MLNMVMQSPYQTFKRYRSLHTHRICALPIVILMPHSACNCRCVMCDIWKGNHTLKQLTEADVSSLLNSLKKYGTQQVLMSGGEALLHPNFFRFCEILKKEKIKISLLSTGLTLKKHAEQLVKWIDDIIVSLDGDEALHDSIRNIPGAFYKIKEGIKAIREIDNKFPISGRTVIHQLNFRFWPQIIDAAKNMGLNTISFLPADVSSTAFNRELQWDKNRQEEILLTRMDLPELRKVMNSLYSDFSNDFKNGFIAEMPEKLEKIYAYYAAYHGMSKFPFKKCNAPWVSTVIEADGTVRPCFFHEPYGNIQSGSLESIINSEAAIAFRKNLNMEENEICKKCVCYLNLSPTTNLS